MRLKGIKPKEIIASDGSQTIEVEIGTEKGVFSASVPSGVSTGKYEAVSLEAGRARENIKRVIAPALTGKQFNSQKEIDDVLIELDGAEDKSRLGANSLLAVSVAALRALAGEQGTALYKYIAEIFSAGQSSQPQPAQPAFPRPMALCIEGGRHGKSKTDIQEFMVCPDKGGFGVNIKACQKIYDNLMAGSDIGLEGGFTLAINNACEAIDLIIQAVNKADVGETDIALDIAASEFFNGKDYNFEGRQINALELLDYYKKAKDKYPIFSIEDPFSQNDWDSWQKMFNSGLGIMVVGDDLTATNPKRIKTARQQSAINGMILKPNQIGTVSEALEAGRLAKSFGWQIIVSHRARETMDDFIADLAVGISADFIKSGAPKPKERMAKYNRILEIEREIA